MDRLLDWITPSAHTLTVLAPNWPVGFDQWEGFIAVFLLAYFKLFRGTTMQRRAAFIDRFGWSIILYDYIFFVVFAASILFSLYPTLDASQWIGRVLLGLLIVVTVWQFIEVKTATPHRIQHAAGPEDDGHVPWDLNERRVNPPRRQEDRRLRSMFKVDMIEP